MNMFPTVDLFASHFSKKCNKYFSKRMDPEASAMDAFTQDWSQQVVYAFPPPNLLWRTITKILENKCNAIVIALKWTSRSWHQRLQLLVDKSKTILPDMMVLPLFTTQTQSQWRVYRIHSQTRV
jgi:hypothetical protein